MGIVSDNEVLSSPVNYTYVYVVRLFFQEKKLIRPCMASHTYGAGPDQLSATYYSAYFDDICIYYAGDGIPNVCTYVLIKCGMEQLAT